MPTCIQGVGVASLAAEYHPLPPARSCAYLLPQILQPARHPNHHSNGSRERRGSGVGRQRGANVHAGCFGGAPGEGGRRRLRGTRAYR